MSAVRVRPRSANARHHAEWLALMDVSGPFLSLPVLDRTFPQGLDQHDSARTAELRRHYEDWTESDGGSKSHLEWVKTVLEGLLELPHELVVAPSSLPEGLDVRVAQHHETLRPDLVVVNPTGRPNSGRPRLLVQVVPRDQDLEKPLDEAEWKASPATRMTELLRGAGSEGVSLGLLTNGEQWMLVYAPRQETSGYATWQAELWLEEPVTLRAFRSLVGVRRLFGVPEEETLEALYSASANDQQSVTDRLGMQVRHAVEILVQAIDRIDQDRKRKLLEGFDEKQLYAAAVNTMMRLVFLLYAEEKRLLPIDDPFYAQNLAASTLLEQLQEDDDRLGKQVLERRYAAWNRLLATFRSVHGGVEHDRLRLPAHGGGLFDPDRFPFLEGRPLGSGWRDVLAQPLEISDATVLGLLRSIQFLEVQGLSGGGAEAQRLSFEALGVEQIGHVYESLLDHTAVRATSSVIGLSGSKSPEVPLDVLEGLRKKGKPGLLDFLVEATGKSQSSVDSALNYEIEADDTRWQVTCGGDSKLLERVRPWAGLVREDSDGLPVVIPAGSVYATKGSDRRSTGTHYTPPSLTEPVVRYTLEPLVFEGPAEGKPQDEWTLRTPREILDLKVCDMACGSGAFLVQACRYLSVRLAESWARLEAQNPGRLVVTPEGEMSTARPSECIIPAESNERLAVARRLVADRCLYGVDINPMAVEMAKLSMWLVTLEKDRPFSFLDHAIKCGDSLLGISDINQIKDFSFDLETPRRFIGVAEACERAFNDSEDLRAQLERMPVLDISDSVRKAQLLQGADEAVAFLRIVGDILAGEALATQGPRAGEVHPELSEVPGLMQEVAEASRPPRVQSDGAARLQSIGAGLLATEYPSRRPFHWPLEFPEVFRKASGFDGFIGNPPFMYGTLATTSLGADYTAFIQRQFLPWHGKTDLVLAFFKRAAKLIQPAGLFSLIATSSAIRGESLDSGLKDLVKRGFVIYQARRPFLWPGTASTEVIYVSLTRLWRGAAQLDGSAVPMIGLDLEPISRVSGEPYALSMNAPQGMLGVKLAPGNREVAPDRFQQLRERAPRIAQVARPTIGGDELSKLVDLKDAPLAIDPNSPSFADPEVRRQLTSVGYNVTALSHSAPAKALMAALATCKLAFACGETVVHLAFRQVPLRGYLLKHKLIVFPAQSWETFSLLQSTFHATWAWRWGLRREQRLVYSPKRCAATFPLPSSSGTSKRLSLTGERYHELRQEILVQRDIGLTDLYNLFHDQRNTDSDIKSLRRGQVDLDREVSEAYGWSDLSELTFQSTSQGVRFTFVESQSREVLERLLSLNHDLMPSLEGHHASRGQPSRATKAIKLFEEN